MRLTYGTTINSILLKTHKGKSLNLDKERSNALKNQLMLIEGEIGAGNNNIRLLIELKNVLEKMVKINLVSQKDAKLYLNQFVK